MIPTPLAHALETIPDCHIATDTSLSELTTFHLGGRPRATLTCTTAQAVAQAVGVLDDAGVEALVVGGGSNLVIADGELDLVAVVVANTGVDIGEDGLVRAQAGTVWDEVVAATVDAGLGGLECLAGSPGAAGATRGQNGGAYGAEIADVLTRVQLYDRATGQISWVPAQSLELSYRYSNLKFTQRAVVLAVEFQLLIDALSAPLRYGELARRLGATEGEQRFPVAAVRAEVLALRAGKGMVVDPQDHDTWSAGSFFTNPIVADAQADAVAAAVATTDPDGAAAMPRYPAGTQGQVKLSAAWLIERAGFAKGHLGPGGRAGLSTKHTLALTNRGQATTEDLVALARQVRDGVREAFGVELVPEPVWVGVEL